MDDIIVREIKFKGANLFIVNNIEKNYSFLLHPFQRPHRPLYFSRGASFLENILSLTDNSFSDFSEEQKTLLHYLEESGFLSTPTPDNSSDSFHTLMTKAKVELIERIFNLLREWEKDFTTIRIFGKDILKDNDILKIIQKNLSTGPLVPIVIYDEFRGYSSDWFSFLLKNPQSLRLILRFYHYKDFQLLMKNYQSFFDEGLIPFTEIYIDNIRIKNLVNDVGEFSQINNYSPISLLLNHNFEVNDEEEKSVFNSLPERFVKLSENLTNVFPFSMIINRLRNGGTLRTYIDYIKETVFLDESGNFYLTPWLKSSWIGEIGDKIETLKSNRLNAIHKLEESIPTYYLHECSLCGWRYYCDRAINFWSLPVSQVHQNKLARWFCSLRKNFFPLALHCIANGIEKEGFEKNKYYYRIKHSNKKVEVIKTKLDNID